MASRLKVLQGQLNRIASSAVPPRTARPGDSVLVHCEAWYRTEEGAQAAELFENDEVVVTIGDTLGVLMPALGLACIGLEQGKSKAFRVTPEDNGHPQPRYDRNLRVETPTHGTEVTVGATVKIQHQGTVRPATVAAFNRETGTALLDMNDPLAGQVLECTVRLKTFDVNQPEVMVTIEEPSDRDVPARRFNLEVLRHYNGVSRPEIYVSLCGIVYDVTSAARMYGPGGMYHFVAGHDASVALGKFKIDPTLCDKAWEGLSSAERQSLAHYVRTFLSKYPIVGKLSAPLTP